MLVVYKSAKRGRGRVREPFTPALCTGHRQQDSLSLSHPTKGPRFDFASPESSYLCSRCSSFDSSPEQSNPPQTSSTAVFTYAV